SISLLRQTKLGPPTLAPLGSHHQSLVSQPCPFSKQPSPYPHQSPQGDFGCVTPGTSRSITGPSPPAYPNLTSLGSLGSRFQAPGSPSPRPHPCQLSLGDFGLVIPGAPYCRLCPPLLLPQGQTPWALCAGVSKDLGPNPVFPSPIVEWDSDILLMCPPAQPGGVECSDVTICLGTVTTGRPAFDLMTQCPKCCHPISSSSGHSANLQLEGEWRPWDLGARGSRLPHSFNIDIDGGKAYTSPLKEYWQRNSPGGPAG
ncbi:PREDICTED: uncharacterized protein LOC108524928, partial [Rhinopithecus bieti]|uniref:uncharacterized protein LOC108524928 n=1 Tax=Rhinopithecus bieti TaxID=61621 RepID=UPI00083C58AF